MSQRTSDFSTRAASSPGTSEFSIFDFRFSIFDCELVIGFDDCSLGGALGIAVLDRSGDGLRAGFYTYAGDLFGCLEGPTAGEDGQAAQQRSLLLIE